MDLVSPSPTRTEYIHDDRTQTRVAMVIIGFGAAACVVGSLMANSIWPAALASLISGSIILRLHLQTARTRVIFDTHGNKLLLEHRTPSGRLLGSGRYELSSLENVVAEKAGPLHNFMSRKVWQRPVMIIAGQRVPLTYRSFETGSGTAEIITQLRDRFGLPRSARSMAEQEDNGFIEVRQPRASRAAKGDEDEDNLTAIAKKARAIREQSVGDA
ncbi:hypothetical protein [Pannonibacter indicus]|uniref:hypothetical protein n=1 Tax=Pannonibacter indicus TaxID=466044 RepID=UPI0035ADB297